MSKPNDSTLCERVRDLLAGAGTAALARDREARQHVESCDRCFELLEQVANLDQALTGLAVHDAPDGAVERLLANPELASAPPENTAPQENTAPPDKVAARWRWPSRRFLALAASITVVTCAGLLMLRTMSSHVPGSLGAGVASESVLIGADVVEPKEQRRLQEKKTLHELKSLGYLGGAGESAAAPAEESDEMTVLEGEVAMEPTPRPPPPPAVSAPAVSVPASPVPLAPPAKPRRAPPAAGERQRLDDAPMDPGFEDRDVGADRQKNEDAAAAYGNRADLGAYFAGQEGAGRELDKQVAEKRKSEAVSADGEAFGLDERAYEVGRSSSTVLKKDVFDPVKGTEVDRINVGGKMAEAEVMEEVILVDPALPASDRRSPAEVAELFWASRSGVEGLAFQPAEGYWANTYVPGDPALRYLAARLASAGRTPLAGFTNAAAASLHDAARQTPLPLDPPSHAALAVDLHADRSAVNGPTRLLLRAALRGTPRYSGRRPAMNVGVVLDLRGDLSTEVWASLRALCAALVEARDLGDRFQLFVAGRPGAHAVEAEAFRHGPVTVALQRLSTGEGAGQTLSLRDAFSAAQRTVTATDDPTRPLGSSVVLLVTASSLQGDLETLAELAHRSAVGGVPVSAVGVGPGAVLAELDRLALAGQGSRRLLDTPADAEALVDRELMAVARVVARAVRLRIRLAPGVRLVEVIASERLDDVRSEQVRRAEKAIDRRLSRNLGIAADRGEDEEGIQIVLPSYYAGDTHAVLLDVVVPGPGAVADVTVRYKDLVQMGNAVTRDHLHLHRGDDERGPLERSVVKSYLAHRLQSAFADAGERLAAGDAPGAAASLEAIRDILDALRRTTPGFENDRDLARDLAMVDDYLALLDAGAGTAEPARSHLADSLRYAGRLKVLPRPAEEGGR